MALRASPQLRKAVPLRFFRTGAGAVSAMVKSSATLQERRCMDAYCSSSTHGYADDYNAYKLSTFSISL